MGNFFFRGSEVFGEFVKFKYFLFKYFIFGLKEKGFVKVFLEKEKFYKYIFNFVNY